MLAYNEDWKFHGDTTLGLLASTVSFQPAINRSVLVELSLIMREGLCHLKVYPCVVVSYTPTGRVHLSDGLCSHLTLQNTPFSAQYSRIALFLQAFFGHILNLHHPGGQIPSKIVFKISILVLVVWNL